MNIPVSFELAKTLKEKEFDELTTVWHQRGEGVVGCIEGKRDYYNRKGEVYISAPTIAEVVMWLYEKHGIWVECYIDDDGTFGYLVSMITKEGRIDYPLKREFKSPTEAYEAAIECILQKLT